MQTGFIGRAVLAGIFAAAPALTAAQEVIGKITGTLDDAEREWVIMDHHQGSQSEFHDYGIITTLTLFGQPDGAGPLDTEQALIMDMSLQTKDPPVEGREVSVRYLLEGLFKGYTSSYDNEPQVVVTKLKKTGGGLSVAGTVNGQLGRSEGPGQAPDFTDARTLEATFEAMLPAPG